MKKMIQNLGGFLPMTLLLLLTACGQGSSSAPEGATTGELPVTLSLRLPKAEKASLQGKVAVNNVASLEISVRGPGMAEINTVFSVNPGEQVSHTLDIPVGLDRIFVVRVFDPSGNAIYEGQSAATDILPPNAAQVSILLNPVRLNLPSELPKVSDNYLLRDTLGLPSFVLPASSTDYLTTVGLPKAKNKPAVSKNYRLR